MEKVSFKKAVMNDRLLFSATLLSVIFFLVSLGIGLSSGFSFAGDSFGFVIVLVWFGLSFLTFLLRVIKLSRFKSESKLYKATVVDIFSFRSSRQIKYEYTVDNVEYKNVNVVIINKASRNIRKGEQVEINISETNPKNSLIRDIYFDVSL